MLKPLSRLCCHMGTAELGKTSAPAPRWSGRAWLAAPSTGGEWSHRDASIGASTTSNGQPSGRQEPVQSCTLPSKNGAQTGESSWCRPRHPREGATAISRTSIVIDHHGRTPGWPRIDQLGRYGKAALMPAAVGRRSMKVHWHRDFFGEIVTASLLTARSISYDT